MADRMKKRAEVIQLTEKERALIAEALDSHKYWQLSDEQYRSDGYVMGRGSDSRENRREIKACDKLLARLVPDTPPRTSPTWTEAGAALQLLSRYFTGDASQGLLAELESLHADRKDEDTPTE